MYETRFNNFKNALIDDASVMITIYHIARLHLSQILENISRFANH